jgi:branched-chain amino acid transport system permease protein
LFLLLRHTAAGRQLRAVGESPREAALLGIQVERVYVLAAALAGALGAAAGVLGSLPFEPGSAAPAAQMLFRGIVVLILGSLGSLRGAVLGGLLLGLGEVLAMRWWPEGPYEAVALGLLLLTLLLRPGGLFTGPLGAVGEVRP